MKIVDFFDKIYCINLDHRTDRWQQAQEEFEKIGIKDNVTRFSAIKNEINGALGCRDSHLAIIKEAKLNNYKNILIFEDDVLFYQDNIDINKIEQTLDELSNLDWFLFYFGTTVDPNVGYFNKITNNIVKTNFAYALQSYAVNYKIFDKVLMEAPHSDIIDVYYNQRITPLGKSLIINPIISIQQPNIYSDIVRTVSEDYVWMIDFFNKIKEKSNIL
jgi:GR25 family glycosyltransferase involved in LPS biosynthesis